MCTVGLSWSCLLFWPIEIIRMKISIIMSPDALFVIKRGEHSVLLSGRQDLPVELSLWRPEGLEEEAREQVG